MDIHDVLAEGRAAATEIMTDTMKVTRRSGRPVTDPDGNVTFPSVTVHDGPGRVQERNTRGETPEYPESSPVITDFELQLPWDVDVRVNDHIEITGSETSPLMIGRVFSANTVVRKTHGTKTRVIVEEAS